LQSVSPLSTEATALPTIAQQCTLPVSWALPIGAATLAP
jgi:hypothetical protein